MVVDLLKQSRKESPEQVARLHTVDTPRGEETDVMGGRYEITIDQPLSEFANEFCKAYVAKDRDGEHKRLYALIGYNELPFRDRATEIMQNGSVPHLIRCHASGPITLSDTQNSHRAFILQRPNGKRLSDILKHSGSLPESFIIHHVIRPVAKMLYELEAQGINHGCINADSVYYEKEITIDENCALPSGFMQKLAYEAPDRMIAMRTGKGAGETSGDYYSLGILALHLLLGHLPNERLNQDQLLEKIFREGAYNAFVPEVELSEAFQDFLRGTINEDRVERWNADHMQGWIEGKRYNAIAPSAPKDSVRPFDYNKKQFFTRRQIAHHLYKDWKTSKTKLSGYKLMRWLESNIKKTDVCTQVERVIPIYDDEYQSRILKDEELSRLITALDPQGPIRYRITAINIDALGPALADSIRNDSNAMSAQLLSIIDNNLIGYADGMLEGIENPVTSTVMWRLQGLRPILKAKGLGFGFERILYQLNPSLCCQQKMLLPHYCYNLRDTLITLNNLAPKYMHKHSLYDRHLAAFITNRLDLNREVKIVELNGFPDLAKDQTLVMLKILTMAQQKLRNPPLPGLTRWATQMVESIVDDIHQRSKRESLREKINNYTEKGVLEKITFLVFNKELFTYDRREHARAEALFKFHYEMLLYLQDTKKIRLKARVFGQQTAWFISIISLVSIVIYCSKPFL